MTTEELRNLTLHGLQRAINVEHYLSVHREAFEEAFEILLKGDEESVRAAEHLSSLMDIQGQSVPEGFAGPLMQPNMNPGFPPEEIKLEVSR